LAVTVAVVGLGTAAITLIHPSEAAGATAAAAVPAAAPTTGQMVGSAIGAPAVSCRADADCASPFVCDAGTHTCRPSRAPLWMFWIFGALALAGTLGMVLSQKPVAGVLSLVGAFAAQAGIYVLLDASFLAAIQVLVYAGAIMVLFVFVIMLLNREEREDWDLRQVGTKALGVFAIAYIVAYLAFYLASSPRAAYTVLPGAPPDGFGGVESVGQVLFSGQTTGGGMTDYLVPFELLSLVLLVAIVGALVVARPGAARRAARATAQSAPPGSQATSSDTAGAATAVAKESHG
jgi:NADH:ubiquinone oxidoreductase subunit 6 (subunit J)